MASNQDTRRGEHASTSSTRHEYEAGDMVWAKVQSHPWWPGHIYHEAFTSPSVKRSKQEGHVLVAFFGDSSYGWFDPAELIPFEENFNEMSRQTSQAFVNAVEEAVDELSRRSSLGLACRCRNPFNFFPSSVKGYMVVNVGVYESYSLSQISEARDSFQPREMLSFLQQLALTPMNDEHTTIKFMKNKFTVLACRRALYEEFDETYLQAFGIVPVRPPRPTAPVDVDPSKAHLSGQLVIAEALGKDKVSVNPTKIKAHKCLVEELSSEDASLVEKKKKQKKEIRYETCAELEHAPVSSSSSAKMKSVLGKPLQFLHVKNDMPIYQKNVTEKSLPSRVEAQRVVKTQKIQLPVPVGDLEKKGIVSEETKRKMDESKVLASQKKNVHPNLPKPKREASKRVEQRSIVLSRTMLIMKFPVNARLPSVAELKAKFAHFGKLDHSATRVYWNSYECQLVYHYKANAEAALEFCDTSTLLLGNSGVKCHIRELAAEEFEPVGVPKEDTSVGVSQPRVRMSGESQHPQVQLKSCLKKPAGDESAKGNRRGRSCAKLSLGGKGSSVRNKRVSEGGSSSTMDATSKNMPSFVLPQLDIASAPPVQVQNFAGSMPFDQQHRVFNLPPFPRTAIAPQWTLLGGSFSTVDTTSKNMPSFVPPQLVIASAPPVQFQPFPGNMPFDQDHRVFNLPPFPRNAITQQNPNDISLQMLNLLDKCYHVVNNVREVLGYMPYHPL